MSDAEDKAKRIVGVAGAVATIAGTIHVTRDEEHQEVKRVAIGPVPVFWRDDKGRPRVLGIPFRRWFRGPR